MTTKSMTGSPEGRTRRDFLKTTSAAAAGAAAFTTFFTVKNAEAITTGENTPDPVSPATGQSIVYRFSNCQNCHSRCGLMGKVVGPAGSTDPAAGVLVKLEGNPFHPNNMEDDERLPFSADPAQAIVTPGRLCPKGHAGVQVLYDPYRVKRPMKRVGARGSGRWQVISWSTALSEIAAKINALIPVASRLSTPIDLSRLPLGPIANQLMFAPGRSEDKQIIERIFKNTWGSQNYRLDHTSICEVDHHVANELMTWDVSGKKGRKDHFKPDLLNTEYLIIFGGNYVEANFPMLALSRKLAEFKKTSGRTLVVVDPRLSNTAAKADIWLPAKPGTDGAVALAMAWRIMQRIINGDVDAANSTQYLKNPNAAAATADGEYTWTDMTRLVVVGMDSTASGNGHTIGKYLRGNEVSGLGGAATDYVVWTGGAEANASTAADGDLLPGELTVSGAAGGNLYCKTVFELLKEEIYDGKSVAYYAAIAGLDAGTLQSMADAFLLKGKKAVANTYRGTVQHTNGFQAQKSVMLLNTLVGNFDWKGGNTTGGGKWSFDANMFGSGSGSVDYGWGTKYPVGPRVDRAKAYSLSPNFNTWYENTYGTYPAVRPWGPYWTHGNFQEAFLGIANQYPYACKVLITYWNAWPYSTPALRDVFNNAIRNEEKIPLFVAITTTMGEVEVFADYILPETTYLEKWCFPGGTQTITTKFTNLRQPLVGSFDGKPWDAPFDVNGTNNYSPVYPETRTLDDILIQLMSALGLTTDIKGDVLPANHWAESKLGLDYLAAQSGQSADDIVARGGVFADPGTSYSGNYLASRYANEIKVYTEEIATTIDSMYDDGAGTSPLAAWDASTAWDASWTNRLADVKRYRFNPLPAWEPLQDIKGRAVNDLSYPFQLITWKTVLHGQARTIDLSWLSSIEPENFVWINTADANALGIRTYDRIRLISPTNQIGVIGRALVTEAIRPGVVGASHHYGHWEHASRPHTQDGTAQPYDASRSLGINLNPVMRMDPALGDVSLQSKIGGSCSFSDTRVQIEKVA